MAVMNDNELDLDELKQQAAQLTKNLISSTTNSPLQIESFLRKLKALKDCVMTLQSNEGMRVATTTIYTEQRIKFLEDILVEQGKDITNLQENVKSLEAIIKHLLD